MTGDSQILFWERVRERSPRATRQIIYFYTFRLTILNISLKKDEKIILLVVLYGNNHRYIIIHIVQI